MALSNINSSLTVNGNTFDLSTPEGRFAASAYAYHIMCDDGELAASILKQIERFAK